MKQAFLYKGEVYTREVDKPKPRNGQVLVQTRVSCISAGTEMSGVRGSGVSLYKRAMENPQKVISMLEIARVRGIKAMKSIIDSARGSNFGSVMGYTAAGVVVESKTRNTQYSVGDRVAVVGTNYANHAEYNTVPENLVIRIPDNVSFEDASTAALGGIAMQGFRQLNPNPGDTVIVMGLGMIGQLVAQILVARGCSVIGIDINNERLELCSKAFGIDTLNGNDGSLVNKVLVSTSGRGADGVVFTAATSSSVPMSNCFKMLRRKGIFVLVGVSGMQIDRDDIYKKELTFKIATSYGPGRYDQSYEEQGYDYPRSFVRFTEQRNIMSYFELLSKGVVNLSKMSREVYSITDANKAYRRLAQPMPPLLSLLSYDGQESDEKQMVSRTIDSLSSALKVGFIGTGSYVKGMHLPNMSALNNEFQVVGLMNRSPIPAMSLATQYHASFYTTDYNRILQDTLIDTIFVCTRHDTHANYAIKALSAGKNVYLEKPAALNEEELHQLTAVASDSNAHFVIGFNRRFSKYARVIKKRLANRKGPVVLSYTMNAGYVPYDIWVQTSVGGGRIIGEGCHIIDLFIYLLGSDVKRVDVNPLSFNKGYYRSRDNVSFSLFYNDGSIATLNYLSNGAKTMPKETLHAYYDGHSLFLNDYMSLFIDGKKVRGVSSPQPDKGQVDILKAFYDNIKKGDKYLIPLYEIELTTRISFEVAAKVAER